MNGRNNEISLEKRLEKYSQSDYYPFHMPGHKRKVAPEGMSDIYAIDITEIDGFDNLHEAEDVLKEAQTFAADLYGSEETHFLVNGSTAGILAAIAGVCRDNDCIAVARNCHKSVYHAIELNRLKPVYIYPDMHTKYGINEGIYPQDVENLWITSKNIRAIVITSPTYDGVVSDIKKICEIAHRHAVPVIVDEAHGAHFNFSPDFPESAITCGADIVIQSTHKTLPAMTQTALLHINGTLVDREKVRRMLTIYQTSSPSYVLMSSIDGCMRMLEQKGAYMYERHTDSLKRLRKSIHECQWIKMPEKEDFNPICTFDYDISKLVLSVRNTNITGKQLYHMLLHDYHLQMEMMSADYVLAMTGIGDDEIGYQRLLDALLEIDSKLCLAEDERLKLIKSLPVSQMQQIAANVINREQKWAEIDRSVGLLAAEYVYIYPPGIPIVTPGEVMTDEIIDTIESWLIAGLRVTGLSVDQLTKKIWLKVSDMNKK